MELLIEIQKQAEIARKFDKDLQGIWSEKDIEKKRELALNLCKKFVFKQNKDAIVQTIKNATKPTEIDKIITNACLSGEGHKVIK